MENNQQLKYEKKHHRSGFFWPLLLISVGVVVLLGNLNLIPGGGWNLLFRLWPLLFIVGGLDGMLRQEGYVGNMLSIGLGGIFLMMTFNLWPGSIWNFLLRFWPVFLVAAGLDLIIGKRSWVSAILGIVAGGALIAGLVLLSFAQPVQANLQSAPLSQKIEDVTRVSMDLEQVLGSLKLQQGSAGPQMIDGSIEWMGSKNYNQSYRTSSGEGIFSLRNHSVTFYFPMMGISTPKWDLNANLDQPIDLKTQIVMGEQELNLESLKVENLNSQTVMGRTVVTLPKEGKVNASIKGVMSETVVRIPKDANVTIRSKPVMAIVSYPDGFQAVTRHNLNISKPGAKCDISLDLEQVMGSMIIEEMP